MKALELTYSLVYQKTEQELVNEYNKNKEQLKMKIENEAMKIIFINQLNQQPQQDIRNNENER